MLKMKEVLTIRTSKHFDFEELESQLESQLGSQEQEQIKKPSTTSSSLELEVPLVRPPPTRLWKSSAPASASKKMKNHPAAPKWVIKKDKNGEEILMEEEEDDHASSIHDHGAGGRDGVRELRRWRLLRAVGRL